MVRYKSIRDSNLNTLLHKLGERDISCYRIIYIFRDGRDYVAVYLIP